MKRSERKAMIPELFEQGKSIEEICEELGYKDPRYVEQTLRELDMFPEALYGIDVPKVWALRKAGWTMDQIIDEFGHKFTSKQIQEAVTSWRS